MTSEHPVELLMTWWPYPVLLTNDANAVLKANAPFLELAGYAAPEVTGLALTKLLAILGPIGGSLATETRSGQGQDGVLTTADGRHLRVRVSRIHLRGESGDRFLFAMHDRTADFETAQKYHALTGLVHDRIVLYDGEHRQLEVREMWNRKASAFERINRGRTIRDVVGPESAAQHEAAGRRALAGESVSYEWSWGERSREHSINDEGSWLWNPTLGKFWFRTRLAPITDAAGVVTRYLGTTVDISHLKGSSDDMVAVLDSKMNLVRFFGDWPTAVAEHLAAGIGRRFWMGLPDETRSEFNLWCHKVLTSGEVRFTWTLKDPAGNAEPYRTTISPLNDGGRRLHGYLVLTQSSRRLAEMEDMLRHATERYAKLFYGSPVPMSLIRNEDGVLVDINRSFCRFTGFDRDELLHASNDGPDPKVVALVSRLSGTKVMSGQEGTLPGRDGADREVLTSAELLNFGGQALLLRMDQDITELKRGQELTRQVAEQRQRRFRLEALGKLSGGIAHDFNNILTVINGHADLGAGRAEGKGDLARSFREIRKAGERAARLTRQLLAFGRRQAMRPTIVNLNATIENMASLLRTLLGEPVRLDLRPCAERPTVFVDEGQIEQVIMNLAINARDAMPGGGTLTIATAIGPEERGGGGAERRVELTISDTGVGMDQATQEQMFDPFFTTKDPSKGTGLGLATVHGIVSQSGGAIAVTSAPDQGTTFAISLPYSAGTPSSEDGETDGLVTRGSETILLAEDEEDIRKLFAGALRDLGYRVLEAENGLQAVELVKRETVPVDLFVTDIMMPFLSGPEAVEHLRGEQPDLKVLYVSGYAELLPAEIIKEAAGPSDILQKPTSPALLARRVRRALDRP